MGQTLSEHPLSRFASRFAMLIACLLSASGCKTVVKTVAMENRLFVRVPGEVVENPLPKNGWSFRHVVEGPRGSKGEAQQWYIAFRKEDRRDRLFHFPFTVPWRHARAMAPEIADACKLSLGKYPSLIEPGLIFTKWAASVKEPKSVRSRSAAPPKLEVSARPLPMWPSVRTADGQHFDPVWYQDDNHTQLASARQRVQTEAPDSAKRIVIAHLDTGFDRRHLAAPHNLVDEPAGDAMQFLRRENDSPQDPSKVDYPGPGGTLGSHGMGTLGILAGRPAQIVDEDSRRKSPAVKADGKVVHIGAAPDATIVAVRVAPWVASFSTANLAYGLDYASRLKKADVISLSHGGSPSQMWTDAVNAAYERGTAIFAATGDYMAPPIPGRLNRLGLFLPPSSTVYPASYRRVMGVSAATAGIDRNGLPKPYALTDWGLSIRHFFSFSGMMHRLMRGSYGADGVRRSFFFGSLSEEKDRVDPSLASRHNTLRSYPISTYSPAIPWLEAGKPNHTEAPHKVALSGAGTSAAAPQAAAAAAHWLALNRAQIEQAGKWNRWQKAEAVYTAMIHSACRPWAPPGTLPADQEPDVFLGAGILKANDMLDLDYRKVIQIHGENLAFPYGWMKNKGVQFDFYDGDRSFFSSVLKWNRAASTEHGDRANLRTRVEESRDAALQQLYFNMLLIGKFQHGKNPLQIGKTSKWGFLGDLIFNPTWHEGKLDRRAQSLADKAPPPVTEAKSTMVGRFFRNLVR